MTPKKKFALVGFIVAGCCLIVWGVRLFLGKVGKHLPDIYIQCEEITYEKKRPCIITDQKGRQDSLQGTIKGRGGASRAYPKRSFSLKLNEKQPLAGLKPSKNFILNANYIDKTMMRHKISYDLFRAMRPQNEAANCAYANLHLNGNYEGLYVIMEKINAKLLGLNKNDSMAMIFKDPPLFWGENRITPQEPDNYFQQTYPKLEKSDKNSYLEAFMDFLFNAPDSIFAREISQWVDLENIIDWHLLLLFTNNGDGVMKNFYLYKQDSRTPFRIAPWDYDHSFGRDGDNEMNMIENKVECDRSILLKRLQQVPALKYEAMLKARWKELRDAELFSLAHFKEMVTQNDRQIRKAVKRNAKKWPDNAPYYKDANHYTQELDIMTAFVQRRIPQLDSCFQYQAKQ